MLIKSASPSKNDSDGGLTHPDASRMTEQTMRQRKPHVWRDNTKFVKEQF